MTRSRNKRHYLKNVEVGDYVYVTLYGIVQVLKIIKNKNNEKKYDEFEVVLVMSNPDFREKSIVGRCEITHFVVEEDIELYQRSPIFKVNQFIENHRGVFLITKITRMNNDWRYTLYYDERIQHDYEPPKPDKYGVTTSFLTRYKSAIYDSEIENCSND